MIMIIIRIKSFDDFMLCSNLETETEVHQKFGQFYWYDGKVLQV